MKKKSAKVEKSESESSSGDENSSSDDEEKKEALKDVPPTKDVPPPKKDVPPPKKDVSKNDKKSESESSSGEETSDEEKKEAKKMGITSSEKKMGAGKIESHVIMKKEIEFDAWIENKSYKPASTVEIHVKVANNSKQEVKSIQVVLRTYRGLPKKKGSKKKLPKPTVTGTDQEYFQGARFPLGAFQDYSGTVTYTLPEGLSSSAEDVKHELLLTFPVPKRIGHHQVRVALEIPIKK